MKTNTEKEIQNISRRNFCKKTSLIVGGGLLLNTLPLFGNNDSSRF
jgi:hypothetical protein